MEKNTKKSFFPSEKTVPPKMLIWSRRTQFWQLWRKILALRKCIGLTNTSGTFSLKVFRMMNSETPAKRFPPKTLNWTGREHVWRPIRYLLLSAQQLSKNLKKFGKTFENRKNHIAQNDSISQIVALYAQNTVLTTLPKVSGSQDPTIYVFDFPTKRWKNFLRRSWMQFWPPCQNISSKRSVKT